MTHFSDPLRSGAAGTATDSSGRLPLESNNPSGAAYGAPQLNGAIWYSVPATSVTNGLALVQTVSNANFTLQAGTSITATTITISGVAVSLYALDVPRCIAFSGAHTSVSAVFYNIVGFDQYLKPMTQTVSGTGSTNRNVTTKAFAYIQTIGTTGNTTSNVVIGTADIFGAPLFMEDLGTVHLSYNSTLVSTSSGFTAGVATAATATSGDVRGTYSAGSAADGVKIICAMIGIRNPNNENYVYGVAQA